MEITCWDLREEKFVDYRPWMRWCMYIVIWVDGQWHRAEKI